MIADRELLDRWYAAIKRCDKAVDAFHPYDVAAQRIANEQCKRLFGENGKDWSDFHPEKSKMYKIYAELCADELDRFGEPANAAWEEQREADAAYKELAAEIQATPARSPIGLAVFALMAWNAYSHLWSQPRDDLASDDRRVRDLVERALEYAGVPLPETPFSAPD